MLEPQVRSVGGFNTYLYGLDSIPTGTQRVNKLVVVYVMHPRLSDHTFSERIIRDWLSPYTTKEEDEQNEENQVTAIGVTFDLRNHGERLIDAVWNEDWGSKGHIENPHHAVDMMSCIDGSVQDITLVMDYLPDLLPFKVDEYVNVVAGVSLGGHIAWRFAAYHPYRVQALIPVVACPSLGLMMVHRFCKQVLGLKEGQFPSADEAVLELQQAQTGLEAYKAIGTKTSNHEEQKYFPVSQFERTVATDIELETRFPAGLPTLLLCGETDRLVPCIYTKRWVNINDTNADVELFIQPDTGHMCTPEMVEYARGWLERYLASI